MSNSFQNIFLIGPMGAGKTTIGKQLAALLKLEFFDCDHEIENLTGVSVNLIFDLEGEAGFRQRESRLLNQLTAKKGVLISTGGGVICQQENRKLLRSRGFVVYLKTSIEKQLKRLRQDKSRPLLQVQDRTQRLLELARQRNPLYDTTANLVFSTGNQSVHGAARTLHSVILEQANPLNVN